MNILTGKLKLRGYRVLAFVLALCLFLGLISLRAFAAEEPEYQGIHEAKLPGYDLHFVYSDAWFTESSFTYNPHLATLSMMMALSSGSKADASQFLTSMGYEKVKNNAYFDNDNEPALTAGAALGQKKIRDNEGDVTLIAVVIHGFRYQMGWEGDFHIGKGPLHEGFLLARDEVLRFMKQYIREQGITGRVKFWLGGHSRGGALANMTAAYLADPSNGYLPNVEITSEDVYCYTFATPGTMVKGEATKGEFGKVSAARSGDYASDTAGEAYNYTGSDGSELIDPSAKTYKGIHNYRPASDLIPGLPPKSWSYTCFGTENEFTPSVTKEEMLACLDMFGKEVREAYEKYGGPENYGWKTFNVEDMSFTEDKTAGQSISQEKMFTERIEGMMHFIGGREQYVESGCQDALSALVGLLGTLRGDLTGELTKDKTLLIRTALYTYIGYIKKWYKAEKGQELTDGEAASMAICTFLGPILGEELDPKKNTLDDLIFYLCKYIGDHTEPEYDPDRPRRVLKYKFDNQITETLFTFMYNYAESAMTGMGDTVYSLICQCAYGGKDHKGEPADREAGKTGRTIVYTAVLILFDLGTDISSTVGTTGSCTIEEFISVVLPAFYPKTDANGKTVKCSTVDEAADQLLVNALETALNGVIKEKKLTEEGFVTKTLRGYIQRIAAHADVLRDAITGMLFYSPGQEFDVKEQIRLAATFLGQADAIVRSHEPQSYLAWLMAADDAYPYVTASVEPGKYDTGITVTLSAEKDRKIYYTLDGSEPTEKSTAYTQGIQLAQEEDTRECRIRAVAVRDGRPGRVWEYTYQIRGTKAEEDQKPPEETKEEKSSPLPWILGGVGGAALLGLIIFLILKKKRDQAVGK